MVGPQDSDDRPEAQAVPPVLRRPTAGAGDNITGPPKNLRHRVKRNSG